MNQPKSFQTLLQELRGGKPITVEMSGDFLRTLFYENDSYWEQTPDGKKKISRGVALGYLRVFIARLRDERREQRQGKRKA